MKKFKPQFRIGDYIEVTHHTGVAYPFNARRVSTQKLANPRLGWVTGYKWLQEGKVKHDYDDTGFFQETGRERVVCYKTHLLGKELYAKGEHCSWLISVTHPQYHELSPKIPYGQSLPTAHTTRTLMKKDFKEYPDAYPRNAKGQFIAQLDYIKQQSEKDLQSRGDK